MVDPAVATVSVEITAVAPLQSIKFWNNPSKTPLSTGISSAIDFSDSISILKMIVGLNVNANGVPLSPYQVLAADLNQNGDVELNDAIDVLKKIVGLSSPEPTWKYLDESKIKPTLPSAYTLSPKNWVGNAGISGSLAASQDVSVVGVLTGDVNGSWG